ncbi:MAG: hypothetical protein ACK5HT_04430 [Draconibacterium sp.]
MVTRGGYEILPDYSNEKKGPFFEAKAQKEYGDGLDEHIENLLSCIREGGTLNAPVEIGAKTGIVSEMGNMAYRVGQRIHWNNSAKLFNEAAANKLMGLSYNKNWQLPGV